MEIPRAYGALLLFVLVGLISAADQADPSTHLEPDPRLSTPPLPAPKSQPAPAASADDAADTGVSRSGAARSASARNDSGSSNSDPADSERRVFRVTAYCDIGLTASGVPSGVGQCAAPADIPFGSRIYVPELDATFVVTDRTHKRFRHNTVDLFIPSKSRCLEFGRHYLECVILPPEQDYRYASPKLVQIVDQARRSARLPGS
jgi:3D (Asp-Asp-Asp) domain-containing protein